MFGALEELVANAYDEQYGMDLHLQEDSDDSDDSDDDDAEPGDAAAAGGGGHAGGDAA